MAVIQQFEAGDTVRSTATFTVGSTNTDPDTVTVRFRDPFGVITPFVFGTDPEVSNTAVGVYRIDHQMSIPGEWWVRWEGTGAAAGIAEERVFIKRSMVV